LADAAAPPPPDDDALVEGAMAELDVVAPAASAEGEELPPEA